MKKAAFVIWVFPLMTPVHAQQRPPATASISVCAPSGTCGQGSCPSGSFDTHQLVLGPGGGVVNNAASLGIFRSSSMALILRRQNGSSFRNAKPGESVALFATGLTISPAGVLPVAQAVSGVSVTIGSTTVPATYAGLVAVGEFQLNFNVPQLANGSYPISIAVNGVSSPSMINSNPPAPRCVPIGQ